jgi:alpha-tubulin suppressor-like RCC1 family protein
MVEVRMRSVAAGWNHSLALSWDGRVYSWGDNDNEQLGQGDKLARPAPALMEGLGDICSVAAAYDHGFAVTQLGAVFSWGEALLPRARNVLWPVIVEGFGGVRVRRVCAEMSAAFAIGEAGELFSWGRSGFGRLGHGDGQDQPSPKRVEALRGVQVSSVAVGVWHVLALAEDGLVYAYGEKLDRALLGNPHVERELLPRPVEALRGLPVGSVAAASNRSYAVTDTGELWAWGIDGDGYPPLGHGELASCPLPKPIESLRGVKVDAVAAGYLHTLALADDGIVYAWQRGCSEIGCAWHGRFSK